MPRRALWRQFVAVPRFERRWYDCHRPATSTAQQHAEEALFARIDHAIGVEHPQLVDTVSQVGRSVDEVKDAIAYLERAPQEIRLLHARRLTGFMADAAQAALLIEEAAWELAEKGSARKAVLARYFVRTHLAEQRLRGITSDDRTCSIQSGP